MSKTLAGYKKFKIGDKVVSTRKWARHVRSKKVLSGVVYGFADSMDGEVKFLVKIRILIKGQNGPYYIRGRYHPSFFKKDVGA